MKRFLIAALLLSHCSFDNKTGIWKNSNEVDLVNKNRFENFETLYTQQKSFNNIIPPTNNLKIALDPIQSNFEWSDEFYHNSNNYINFSYKNQNQVIFKSKRLTRRGIKDKFLFKDGNIFITDIKGNMKVFSVEKQKIIYKFNFYKKKFKKLKKNLNFIIEKNIIYISDNIGYLYALNYETQKLIWAKNFKIPFRSNIKISDDVVILADQNNFLYFINKNNGERLKFIPTEEVTIKNDFINSLALGNKSVFFLNTYGSLYSINKKNFAINWFLNFNTSLSLGANNLFFSNQIVFNKDKIIVSTDPNLYVINSKTGSTFFKIPITSIVKPIISGKNLFIITKDNLLVCINLDSGRIIYSIDVGKEIAKFLDSKQKPINIKFLSILNNNLFIFLNNSYLVNFNANGKINGINKLPSKLETQPIFINDSILYLNKRKKLMIIN
jgi:outer membrane protein assembly factor BamB